MYEHVISCNDLMHESLWVSGITSGATESYFTSFLSVAVHFNIKIHTLPTLQNISYSSHFTLFATFIEICPHPINLVKYVNFSHGVIPLTYSEIQELHQGRSLNLCCCHTKEDCIPDFRSQRGVHRAHLHPPPPRVHSHKFVMSLPK